ncbi:MAG: hypothetical protein JWR80_7293 [Bradyrhizobium sp.]|nr:hypothetical protein [Bradyrhizobium sp.]
MTDDGASGPSFEARKSAHLRMTSVCADGTYALTAASPGTAANPALLA